MTLADMMKNALSFRNDEVEFLMTEFPWLHKKDLSLLLLGRDILIVVWCSIVVVGFVKSVLKPRERHNSTEEVFVGDAKQMKKE